MTDEDRVKIEEEERFRQRIRSEIAARDEKKSDWNSLEIVKLNNFSLNSVCDFVVWVYGQ